MFQTMMAYNKWLFLKFLALLEQGEYHEYNQVRLPIAKDNESVHCKGRKYYTIISKFGCLYAHHVILFPIPVPCSVSLTH